MNFKYKITQNENSVTLLLLPTLFYSSTYLYEKYGTDEKAYNFAVGSIQADYKTEIIPMIKDLAENLNEVFEKKLSGNKIIFSDLFAERTPTTFPLFSPEKLQDGTVTGYTSISCRTKNSSDKPLLFVDFAEQKPVAKEDAYKLVYAIEIELKAYFNEEKLKTDIFTTFHRGIKAGTREDITIGYVKNDKAWEGFNFTQEDDLPF